MRFLDWDYDEGKYVITFEAKHSEIFCICSAIEFSLHSLINDDDKNVMKCLHDFLLQVISFR